MKTEFTGLDAEGNRHSVRVKEPKIPKISLAYSEKLNAREVWKTKEPVAEEPKDKRRKVTDKELTSANSPLQVLPIQGRFKRVAVIIVPGSAITKDSEVLYLTHQYEHKGSWVTKSELHVRPIKQYNDIICISRLSTEISSPFISNNFNASNYLSAFCLYEI